MGLSRRGIFGLIAATPVAVAAGNTEAAVPTPEPKFFKGQLRPRISHYETRAMPGGYTFGGPALYVPQQLVQLTESVAVIAYDQWDGERWVPVNFDAKD